MNDLNRVAFNCNLASWLLEQKSLFENELTLLNTMKSIEDEVFLNDNQFNDLNKVVIEYLRLIGIIKEYKEELDVLINFLVP